MLTPSAISETYEFASYMEHEGKHSTKALALALAL
jgi:hypothetical protein